MNKILYSILSLGVGISVILNMGQAKASQLINDDLIIPMSDLTENFFNNFFLEEIADGDTSNFNGFSSGSATGTIKLDLIGNFDLESFLLWNDVNVNAEGIKDFRLDFFNSSDSFIQSSNIFIGPLGQFEAQEYIFDQVVPDVSRVDLVVLSSYPGFGSDIEIREVAFTGNVTVLNPPAPEAVPEPSSIISLFIIGNLGYLLKRKIQH